MKLITCLGGAMLGLLPVLTPSLEAASVSIVATADTGIMQDTPNNNMGTNTTVASGGLANRLGNVGPTRALFQFDLTGQIPPGAVVTSATVKLQLTKRPSIGPVGSTFGLHRLLVGWGEGNKGRGSATGQGETATTGEATWNNRFHPSTPWGTPGGQANVDYIGGASASLAMNNVGSYTFASTAALVGDVQAWVNNPASNFGWMLISQSENTTSTARRFATSEISTPTSRPTLTVQFTTPPPVIDSFSLAGDAFEFTFLGRQTKNYDVQRSGDLNDPGQWQAITNIGPLNADQTIKVSDPLASPGRFYRVLEF